MTARRRSETGALTAAVAVDWRALHALWRNATASRRSHLSFVPNGAASGVDFWVRRPNGTIEPPRVLVPGTAITARALFDARDDEEELARVWLDAFVWQWSKQRATVGVDRLGLVLRTMQRVLRATKTFGNGYHGNTQQTLPSWNVPLDGARWEDVVKSAARGKLRIEQTYVVAVPTLRDGDG